MKDKIYLVTCFRKFNDHRAVGYFFDLEEAKINVETNNGDIQECYFHFCVIEEVSPGIYAQARVIQWYKWNENEWTAAESPEWTRNVINFGIG